MRKKCIPFERTKLQISKLRLIRAMSDDDDDNDDDNDDDDDDDDDNNDDDDDESLQVRDV